MKKVGSGQWAVGSKMAASVRERLRVPGFGFVRRLLPTAHCPLLSAFCLLPSAFRRPPSSAKRKGTPRFIVRDLMRRARRVVCPKFLRT